MAPLQSRAIDISFSVPYPSNLIVTVKGIVFMEGGVSIGFGLVGLVRIIYFS
jgi:hypothetical protein